jgi:hypothetical protein
MFVRHFDYFKVSSPLVLCEKCKALVEDFHKIPSLQTKNNRIPKNDEEKIKQNLKLLHSQSKM